MISCIYSHHESFNVKFNFVSFFFLAPGNVLFSIKSQKMQVKADPTLFLWEYLRNKTQTATTTTTTTRTRTMIIKSNNTKYKGNRSQSLLQYLTHALWNGYTETKSDLSIASFSNDTYMSISMSIASIRSDIFRFHSHFPTHQHHQHHHHRLRCSAYE